MATNANPLGIFSTALATMPKPFNLSKELSDYQLAQSEAARNNASIPGIQAATQGQQIENQRQKQALEADQAVRDILKQHTQNVPVTPPGAHLPPPPMGSDGQPQMSPEYQAAQVNSAAQVPDLDVGSAALALTKAGYGDRAITLLKTDQELKKQRQELTKADLANFEAQRSAREDLLSGVVEAMYPDGMDKPRSDAGVQKAAQLWASMSPEEKQQAGIPEGVPFDPNMVEAKYRQAAGASGVTKQIAAHLGLKEAEAKTEEAKARTKESTAQAGLVTEQTKQFELSNKAAEEFIKNPSSVLGAGGLIERLGLDPATTNRLKNQIYGLWQMPGTPKEKQQAVNSAIQKATDQANELAKQTNPALLQFDVNKAGAEAAARAKAEAAVFGGNSGTSQIADDVANYRIPFSQAVARLPGAAREAVLAQIKAINPNFQAAQYDVAKKTEEAFTSGSLAKSANSLNTVMGHLGELHEAADALKNGNVQVLNRIANSLGAQAGSTARTTYDAIVHKVGPELTNAYTASGGSVGERGTNEEDFSSSHSPDQIKSNIAISVKLLDSKLKALQDQYQRGTYGRGQQQLLTDEAKATREKLLGGQGGTLPHVTTKAQYDALPSGAVYIEADGKTYKKP
jgi:hypothetical protein